MTTDPNMSFICDEYDKINKFTNQFGASESPSSLNGMKFDIESTNYSKLYIQYTYIVQVIKLCKCGRKAELSNYVGGFDYHMLDALKLSINLIENYINNNSENLFDSQNPEFIMINKWIPIYKFLSTITLDNMVYVANNTPHLEIRATGNSFGYVKIGGRLSCIYDFIEKIEDKSRINI